MLSRKAKYALKALVFIYEHPEMVPVSTKDISEAEKIPYKFLEAIMNTLKQNRIVKSRRGPRGGYDFARAPEEITVAAVMRIIDGPIALTTCTSENFYEKCEECIDEKTCKVRKMFVRLRTSMLPVLERSIAEM
ncbi:Rrf2 family transcriptional regulator [Sinomicrobium pectinilyticum]|uniref:Rrf2 family transcriptional regulator n=1 Tax=Sinomicrobium pectinilyticum TaxID=1084421 RepID=A0A3N0F599_SINP1|nr:Rrf2 family transcriptional regulator [Sinomicrobium pectinilyticum]RNL95152.1 Rrf2 family transcriptional regulator [Sinomicrobium pectinilyticum]